MDRVPSSKNLLAITGAFAVAASAQAALVGSYTVGSGSKSSFLQFEFANSNTYLYQVRYDGSLRGSDLFAIVLGAQPGFFAYEAVTFSFGTALYGVSIGADSNQGFGTPPDYLDYWHYWTREAGQSGWTNSMIGFGDRTVSNGSWDAWVFNSDSMPAAVPSPAAGAAIACGAFVSVRRRRR